MGLILLTWVLCHNLVKIHLVVIEILSFSCSKLLLVKANGDHLAVPNSKKIKMASYQEHSSKKFGSISTNGS